MFELAICIVALVDWLMNVGIRFIDLDTPLLLSEDPVLGGYEGI